MSRLALHSMLLSSLFDMFAPAMADTSKPAVNQVIVQHASSTSTFVHWMRFSTTSIRVCPSVENYVYSHVYDVQAQRLKNIDCAV